MDPHGPTAQRFPLVARFRPACLPPPQRIRSLVELAGKAAATADQGLARELCHQQSAAYLHACLLPGMLKTVAWFRDCGESRGSY